MPTPINAEPATFLLAVRFLIVGIGFGLTAGFTLVSIIWYISRWHRHGRCPFQAWEENYDAIHGPHAPISLRNWRSWW